MDLLDRYLAAISGQLPDAQRADVTAELRDVLLSQVEDKEEALGRPLDREEMEALLKAFGHPLVVAGRYRTFNHLIGPDVFPFYWFALKLILGLAAGIHVITTAVLVAAHGQLGGFGDLVGAVMRNFVPNMVMVIGWTTLAFVAIEYAGAARHLTRWRPRDLPPPHARVRKSRAELVVALAFGIVFFMWWAGLVYFENVTPFTRADAPLRLTGAAIWMDLHTPILVFLGAGLLVNAFDLARPNLNRLNAVLSIVYHLGGVALAALLMQAGHWVDVAGPAADAAKVAKLEFILDKVAFWVLAGIVLAGLWEAGTAAWRLVRISRFQVGMAR
jgi:hypothetical protein